MFKELYHGSNEPDLEGLDGGEPGYRGSLGFGLYLTTQLEFAGIFGKHIYEVESPVPDELVAYIEPNAYECGNSMVLYTPGSVPFTFEIVDLKDGSKHRYSVLENCDEEVRSQLAAAAIEHYKVSQELKDDINAAGKRVADAVRQLAGEAMERKANGESTYADDLLVLASEYEEMTDEEASEAEKLLDALVDEFAEFADEWSQEILGDEIDLDQLSDTVERHGYSAFFIEGYAPGDEYVIFDPKYLPVPVRAIIAP